MDNWCRRSTRAKSQVKDSQTIWKTANVTNTCSQVRIDCSALRSIVKVQLNDQNIDPLRHKVSLVELLSLHEPLVSSHTHRRSITGSRKGFMRKQYMEAHLAMLRGAKSNQEAKKEDMAHMRELEAMEKDLSRWRRGRGGHTVRYTYSYNDEITAERKTEMIEFSKAEHSDLLKYRLCVKESDKKFTRLREHSKLYQMRQEFGGGEGDVATAFTNDRQETTEEIRTMTAPEEREVILTRMERDKYYIACSSKRKSHNPIIKNEQLGGRKDRDMDGDEGDSLIDRAIRDRDQMRKKRAAALEEEKKDPWLHLVGAMIVVLETAEEAASASRPSTSRVCPCLGCAAPAPASRRGHCSRARRFWTRSSDWSGRRSERRARRLCEWPSWIASAESVGAG